MSMHLYTVAVGCRVKAETTLCQPLSIAFARSHYKVTDDTLESSVVDSDVTAWFRPELPQCTNAWSSLCTHRKKLFRDDLKTQLPVDRQFRLVPIIINNGDCPEPDRTTGQPAVGFWSRPLLSLEMKKSWGTITPLHMWRQTGIKDRFL